MSIDFRTVRTPAKIAQVQAAIQGDEHLELADPARQTARRNNLQLTKSSFNRITKQELKLQAYVPDHGVTQMPGDAIRRVNMANTIIQMPLRLRRKFVFGDEKWFTLNGTINKQNMRLYAPKKANGQGGKPGHFRNVFT